MSHTKKNLWVPEIKLWINYLVPQTPKMRWQGNLFKMLPFYFRGEAAKIKQIRNVFAIKQSHSNISNIICFNTIYKKFVYRIVYVN